MENDGGPAFPYDVQRNGRGHHDGMSLRDYFAGQALAGKLAHIGEPRDSSKELAERCYFTADAMLAAREKKR